MLLLKYVLGLTSCIETLVSAIPLRVSGSQTLNLDLDPIWQWNGSTTLPLNVTGNTNTHIECDGASYGFDLDISDCEDAKAYFPHGSDQVQWAERHTGWQKRIVPLPFRAMGDKGSCYVQPVLVDGASSAKATLNEVRNAAAMIRNRCASGGKLQGGKATMIGKINL